MVFQQMNRTKMVCKQQGLAATAVSRGGNQLSISMNPGLLPDSFDYEISEEADCDSLDQHASFSSNQPPYENVGTGTGFRSSGHNSMSQSSVHPLALQAPNGGYEYRSQSVPHGTNDGQFQSGSAFTISPLTSSCGSSSASPSSASGYAILSQQGGQYSFSPQISYNLGQHSNAANATSYTSAFNLSQSLLQHSLDTRTRLSSISPASGMPPPSRPSTNSSPVSAQVRSSVSTDYSLAGTQLSRQSFSGRTGLYQMSRSQSPMSAMSRSIESSHSGAGQNAPPFDPTKSIHKLIDRNGHTVEPTIAAKIDKGFFLADDEWVCYRRNYFAVVCSFELQPPNAPSDQIYLVRGKSQMQVRSFAMTISAKMDSEDGKNIPLVQHTPKRDKGPMSEPDKKELKPNPGGSLNAFQGSTAALGHQTLGHGDYDATFGHSSRDNAESQTLASFERMQFKRATANNGKRRAAQQYFYILVELHCKIRNEMGLDENVKIAHRVSSKMVVRGRSPGHYQDDRRSSHMGPGAGHLGGFPPGSSHHFSTGGPGAAGVGSSNDPTRFISRDGSSYQRHHPVVPQSPPHFGSSHLSTNAPSLQSMYLKCMQDPMSTDDTTADYMYGSTSEFTNSLVAPSSRAENPVLRPSTGNSPGTLFPTALGYSTAVPLKEEFRIPSIKTEDERLSSYRNSYAPPAFHATWQPQEDHTPPRDCKPYAMEWNRPLYHDTALM